MYNPRDVEQFRLHEYKGTRTTTSLRVEESNGWYVVERPQGFVQRANANIHATLELERYTDEIFHEDTRLSSNNEPGDRTGVPHISDADIDVLIGRDSEIPTSFVNVACPDAKVRFERSAESFPSDPRSLFYLSTLLTPTQELRRLYKTETPNHAPRDVYLIDNGTVTEINPDFPDTARWLLRDTLHGTVTIEGGPRPYRFTVAQQEDWEFINDENDVGGQFDGGFDVHWEHNAGYKLGGGFVRIPMEQLSGVFPDTPVLMNPDWTLDYMYLHFEPSEHDPTRTAPRGELRKSGFCYFTNRSERDTPEVGYYKIDMVPQFSYAIAGGAPAQIFVTDDIITGLKEIWENTPADAPTDEDQENIVRELRPFRHAVRLLAPQVKFTPDYRYLGGGVAVSMHNIGTHYTRRYIEQGMFNSDDIQDHLPRRPREISFVDLVSYRRKHNENESWSNVFNWAFDPMQYIIRAYPADTGLYQFPNYVPDLNYPNAIVDPPEGRFLLAYPIDLMAHVATYVNTLDGNTGQPGNYQIEITIPMGELGDFENFHGIGRLEWARQGYANNAGVVYLHHDETGPIQFGDRTLYFWYSQLPPDLLVGEITAFQFGSSFNIDQFIGVQGGELHVDVDTIGQPPVDYPKFLVGNGVTSMHPGPRVPAATVAGAAAARIILATDMQGNHVPYLDHLGTPQNDANGVALYVVVQQPHYYGLLVGDQDLYMAGVDDCINIYSFVSTDQVGTQQGDRFNDIQTGGLESELFNGGLAEQDEGKIPWTNVRLIRYPNQGMFDYIRKHCQSHQENMAEDRILAQDDYEVGARRVGFTITAREPVMCGPISPFGTMDTRRPLADCPRMLPPRLGTYRLSYPVLAETAFGDYRIQEGGVTQTQLVLEYLQAPLDTIEKQLLAAPRYEVFTFDGPVELDTRNPFRVHNGIPAFLYIRSRIRIEEFGLWFRNRPNPILESTQHGWDLAAFTERAQHPRSAIRVDRNATADFHHLLIRFEELGVWSDLLQGENDLAFDFVIRRYNAPANGPVTLMAVYEHHLLQDTHDQTIFRYLK